MRNQSLKKELLDTFSLSFFFLLEFQINTKKNLKKATDRDRWYHKFQSIQLVLYSFCQLNHFSISNKFQSCLFKVMKFFGKKKEIIFIEKKIKIVEFEQFFTKKIIPIEVQSLLIIFEQI